MIGRNSRGTTARDDNLGALGVELGRVALVESQQLVADEVVAWAQVRGNFARPLEVLLRCG